jgi:cytoskeleton protein RodZ
VSTGIGAALQAARDQQGRSLEEVAGSMRARVDQLRALEEERFASFGGDVYAKGFLKNYALELGIDPQPLLETYRREVSHDDAHATALVGGVATPPKQRSAPPAWIAWVLAAVVIVAGFAFLSTVGGGVAPPTASPDDLTGPPPAPAEEDEAETDETDDTVETDETEAEGDGEEAEPEAEEEEPEAEEPDGVELLIALEEASWIRVVIDGTPILEQTMPQGEVLEYRGEEEIEIRYGNPGGVRAELNGEDLGPQGSRGVPVTLRYTLDGVEQA